MEWQVYVYSFLAGVLGANGVPYFVNGINGLKHHTPFGKSSSALINVIWGWVNFVVAMLLLYWGHIHSHPLRAFACFAVGALLLGMVLAMTWSKNAINDTQIK